jgi:hypothetical protein
MQITYLYELTTTDKTVHSHPLSGSWRNWRQWLLWLVPDAWADTQALGAPPLLVMEDRVFQRLTAGAVRLCGMALE